MNSSAPPRLSTSNASITFSLDSSILQAPPLSTSSPLVQVSTHFKVPLSAPLSQHNIFKLLSCSSFQSFHSFAALILVQLGDNPSQRPLSPAWSEQSGRQVGKVVAQQQSSRQVDSWIIWRRTFCHVGSREEAQYLTALWNVQPALDTEAQVPLTF